MRQTISKLKLKPTSNYKKSVNFFVVSYTKKKEENIVSFRYGKCFGQQRILENDETFLSDKNSFLADQHGKNNRVIFDDFDLSEKFRPFFEDAVKLLNVKPDEFYLSDTENLSDPAEIAIRKFGNHLSVQAIRQNISVNQDFYFSNTEVRDILKEITALNNKKNDTFGNIPRKRLKEMSDICVPPLNDIWNKEISHKKGFLIISN